MTVADDLAPVTAARLETLIRALESGEHTGIIPMDGWNSTPVQTLLALRELRVCRSLGDELRRNVVVYAVEGDEETLRLTVYGKKFAAVKADGPKGIALLKLAAALHSSESKEPS